MPENADLRRNISRARKKEMYFAYVSGADKDQMVVDKKPIKPSAAKELKAQAGGGRLVLGRCEFKEGELHLKIDKGRATAQLPKALRALIKEQTGFSWKAAVGQDEAEEETESEDS